MTSEIDQAEALISEAARFRAGGNPRVALDKLRQSSIVLFRAREELERRTILELRAQAEFPASDSFARHLRDAVIALQEAVETRDYMAERSEPEQAGRWSRRVDRARVRIERIVYDETHRGHLW